MYPKIISAYVPLKTVNQLATNFTLTKKGKPFMLYGFPSLATVKVSSTWSTKNQMKHMFDNDLKTFWHSGKSDSKPFVRISFHTPTAISQIILGKRRDCCSTRYIIYLYHISYIIYECLFPTT